MLQFPPFVLADLGAIIKAIILIVFLASGAVKMFRESKEAQKHAERRQQHRARPRPQPGGGQAMQPQEAAARQTPQEVIRSEVDEFLRRAKQTSGDARGPATAASQPAPPPRRQPRIEVLDADSGFDVDQRPRQSRQQPRPEPSRSIKLEPLESAGLARGDSVAEHVAAHITHLKPGEFAERATHLGESVAQTDERLEARLHQKFDHRLGSLSDRRRAREAADLAKKDLDEAPTLAANLLELLSTPQGVQQAVILSEVLSRPADRL